MLSVLSVQQEVTSLLSSLNPSCTVQFPRHLIGNESGFSFRICVCVCVLFSSPPSVIVFHHILVFLVLHFSCSGDCVSVFGLCVSLSLKGLFHLLVLCICHFLELVFHLVVLMLHFLELCVSSVVCVSLPQFTFLSLCCTF